MKFIVEYVDDLHEMTWLILKVYHSDVKLIEQYHIKAGAGLEDCVIDTVEKLMNAKGLEFYSMWDGASMVGYFAIEKGELGMELTSFGIMHNQRTKEVSIAFWDIVKNIAGNDLICALYSRNKPAIEFIKKVDCNEFFTGIDEAEGNAEYKVYNIKLN